MAAIGGAVAPGLAGGKTKVTSVRRKPYWRPWGRGGKGDVKLLPIDTVHTQTIKTDRDGTPRNAYEAKGYVPLEYAPPEARRMFAEMRESAINRAESLGIPLEVFRLKQSWVFAFEHLAESKAAAGADAA